MIGGRCPVGCGRDVAPGKTMCTRCWLHVPEPLKRRVLSASRLARRAKGADRRAAAYDRDTAVEAAVASVPR